MSNTEAWRKKARTPWPNSRQKRNGLFLDSHPHCARCGKAAQEAHHTLPPGHNMRNLWAFMMALCTGCHIAIHRPAPRCRHRKR